MLASDKILIPTSANWFSNVFLTSISAYNSPSFIVFFLVLFTSATSSSNKVSEKETTPISYMASIVVLKLIKSALEASLAGSAATY